MHLTSLNNLISTINRYNLENPLIRITYYSIACKFCRIIECKKPNSIAFFYRTFATYNAKRKRMIPLYSSTVLLLYSFYTQCIQLWFHAVSTCRVLRPYYAKCIHTSCTMYIFAQVIPHVRGRLECKCGLSCSVPLLLLSLCAIYLAYIQPVHLTSTRPRGIYIALHVRAVVHISSWLNSV